MKEQSTFVALEIFPSLLNEQIVSIFSRYYLQAYVLCQGFGFSKYFPEKSLRDISGKC